MNIYTSGMLKAYTECPAKYNLIYNDQVQIPSDNSYAEIGNQIHALINYYYKGHDINNMTGFVDSGKVPVLKELWDNFLEIKPENVIESEYVFNIKLSVNTMLTGRVDGIFKSGKNIIIADWKTGSENINYEKDFQTRVYLYSVYVLLKEYGKIQNFEDLSIVYYFLKTKNKKQVKLSRQYFMQTEQDIILLTNIITADNQYKKSDTADCRNCRYQNLCLSSLGSYK